LRSGSSRRSSPPGRATVIVLLFVPKEHPMLDLILLAVGLGFFALSIGYVYACDRL
jgi:hypothetical protein